MIDTFIRFSPVIDARFSYRGDQRAKPVQSEPHHFLAQIDAALEQEVLHISQRRRESHAHQDDQPDYLRGRVELLEWTSRLCPGFEWHRSDLAPEDRS
jgi:hypothetical protein